MPVCVHAPPCHQAVRIHDSQVGVVLRPLRRKHLAVSGDTTIGLSALERRALCLFLAFNGYRLGYRTAPQNKVHPTRDVNSAEAEPHVVL